MSKDSSKFWEENGVMLALVTLTVVAIVVGFAYSNWRDKKSLSDGPASVSSASLAVDDDDSVLLVLTEFVEFHSEDSDWKEWRTSLLRLRDGRLLGRRVYQRAAPTCQGAINGRIWCVTEEAGPELLDTKLGVIADKARLIATSGALTGGIAKGQPVGLVPGTGELELVGMQGTRSRIHPRTLVARAPMPGDDARVPRLGSSQGSGTAGSVMLSGREVQFEGRPLAKLVSGRTTPRPPISDATFLNPDFVTDPFVEAYRGTTSGGAAILVHDDSLEQRSRVHYCAVREDGTKAWDFVDKKGGLIAAHADGPTLAIIVRADQGYVLGIDTTTGTMKYRYDGTAGK